MLGARSLYLLVPVELGGQLVSPPRRVLGTELRGAALAWGEQSRGVSPLPLPRPARRRDRGRALPGPRRRWERAYPAAGPPAGPGCAAAPRRRRPPKSPWKPRRGRTRGRRSPGPRRSPAPGTAGRCSAEARGRGDGALGGGFPPTPPPAPGLRRAPRGGGVTPALPRPGGKHPCSAGKRSPPAPAPVGVCPGACGGGAPQARPPLPGAACPRGSSRP